MSSLRNTLAAASLLVCASSSAFAAWPSSLAGTSWSGDANGTLLSMNVATQGGGGACQTITGTITAGGTSAMTGYYCPTTGVVEFLRSNGAQTFQVYSGSLSQSPASLFIPTMMSGSFGQYLGLGSLGLYPFSMSH